VRPPSIKPGDVVAGVSVGLVVIPQSIAYAQVAGMPPASGLYAAGLPSIAAAPLQSSRLLQTGPVGVTALLTFGALSSIAEPATAHYVELAVLLALVVGAVRLAVGLLGLGGLAYLLSPPLLAGFMPAAAILIVASQVPAIVGLHAPAEGGLHDLTYAARHAGSWSAEALAVAGAVVALVVGGRRVSRVFPSVLLAVVAGIAFSRLAGYSRPVVGTVPAGFPDLHVHLPWSSLGALLVPGAVIALLGFVEPASIARTLAAQDRERWDPNREFVAQGIANAASAAVGGFPVGGSFSRTSLNRLAGARTRWSGAIAGTVALAFLPLTHVLQPLPTAVLGAVVVVSVAGLLRLGPLVSLWRVSRPQATIATVTFALTLALSPHVEYAVLIGLALSIANHLLREYPLDLDVELHDVELVLKARGVVFFGSAQSLEDRTLDLVAAHPEVRRVVLDLRGVGRLDVSGAYAVRSLVRDGCRAGIDVEVVNVPPRARRFVGAILSHDE
jgi:SulP family sulfate permease